MPRAISWTQILAREKKDILQVRIAELRDIEGTDTPMDRLRRHNRALQEIVELLSEDEVKHYQGLAEKESATRKAPPTPEAIYAYVQICTFPHLVDS